MNAFFYSFRSEDLLMIGHIATTEVKRERAGCCFNETPNHSYNANHQMHDKISLSVFFSVMLNIRSILFFMADRDTRPAL